MIGRISLAALAVLLPVGFGAGDAAAQAAQPDTPALSLDPDLPQSGAWMVEPAPEDFSARARALGRTAWKVWVGGYVRAPLRLSWGPATTIAPNGADAGTQLRTGPLVPDANETDWRYTGSLAPPWTELDFHVGNPQVTATVQIASLNLTDAGYRRLDANLGINQAFLTLRSPALLAGHVRLAITAGGFSNRYGAAGRLDAGRYDTFLFGRTHVAGETTTLACALGAWTLLAEHGFGAKLEPIPFYRTALPNPDLPPPDPARAWDPHSGPVPQESTFVHHGHLGLRYRDALLLGVHAIDVFANDDQRAGANLGTFAPGYVRPPGLASPRITIVGAELRWQAVLGDGYLGVARLDARNADYLGGAIDVLDSAEGWQLHDNFFGAPGAAERATGRIDTALFQHIVSFARLLRGSRTGDGGGGPDLIAAMFAMYNRVRGAIDPAFDHDKLKVGGELVYLPLSWLGIGGRFDVVEPNIDDRTQTFQVASPRLVLRTAFLTHEQILLQYSRYFYGARAAHGAFPYGGQSAASQIGADRNAAQIVALIWF